MKGPPNNANNNNVRSSNYPPTSAVISRDRLKQQRPIFERRVAIAIIALSFLGSFLGLLGDKPESGAPAWNWIGWVLVPLLITAIFQTFVTYAQWQYADARKNWRYIVPTLLSVALSFKGWLDPSKWLINYLTDGWLTAYTGAIQFWIMAFPLLVVTVVMDMWPERVLAGH